MGSYWQLSRIMARGPYPYPAFCRGNHHPGPHRLHFLEWREIIPVAENYFFLTLMLWIITVYKERIWKN